MSEEMNRRESALGDAELENVGGAKSEEDFNAERRADRICVMCGSSHCSATPLLSLETYLKEHGPYSVASFRKCPYYIP